MKKRPWLGLLCKMALGSRVLGYSVKLLFELVFFKSELRKILFISLTMRNVLRLILKLMVPAALTRHNIVDDST